MNSNPRRIFSVLTLLLIVALALPSAFRAADKRGITETDLFKFAWIADAQISPDGSRLAFSALTKSGWEILLYSFDLNRMVSFPRFGGVNLSPSWSPDGKLAFSSSRNGYPNIFVVDPSGGNLRRLTSDQGPDVSPTWNRHRREQCATYRLFETRWHAAPRNLPESIGRDLEQRNSGIAKSS